MSHILPISFVVLLWYFSTGAVLWLARGGRDAVPLRLLIVTALAALGFGGIVISANHAEQWSPYLAFASAIAIWAWAEFTFLTGLLTGPRIEPCPDNVGDWERFRLAFLTISRHEYVLLASLVVIGLICKAGNDFTAFWTFLLLWLMRISAKLTIFTGAPAFSVEMMPARLHHMTSYFRFDRIGFFFWVTTLVTTLVFVAALISFHNGFIVPDQRTTAKMLTTLIALAAFEHWMMILPIKDSALWRWAMPSGTSREGEKSRKGAKSVSAAE